MIQKLFDVHPLLGVCASAILVGLVGCFEFYVLRNRRAAYMTWGFVAFCVFGAFILHLLGVWLS